MKGNDTNRLPGTDLLEYPFPLRGDVIARLVLPNDLTRLEAARIIRFLETLVDEERD